MAILLIGSTGNGKSTFGNFLIDPEQSRPGGAIFKVATDNLPQTQHTKVVSEQVSISGNGTTACTRPLVVIDTPGLNESKGRDLWHMTDLIESLQKVGTIRACIFVAKFGSKIDQQYKETVEYYSKLLPDLFSRNVLVVVTDYQTDKRSEAMRKRNGIKFEVITKNIEKQIIESAGISYSPMLFAIDCLPFDEDEMANSLKMRGLILSYIFSQQEVKVHDLRIQKTKAIKEDDVRLQMKYKGEIVGYSSRLKEVNKDATDALNETEEKQFAISDISSSLAYLRNHLKDLDTDDAVVSCSWYTDGEATRHIIWYSIFDIVSDWDIYCVEKWKDDNCEWQEYDQERRKVHVRLQGSAHCRIHGTVTVFTTKRWKFRDTINELKLDIAKKEAELQFAEKEAHSSREKFSKYRKDIETLEKFMDDIKKKDEEIACDTMTLEEARRRIAELSVITC